MSITNTIIVTQWRVRSWLCWGLAYLSTGALWAFGWLGYQTTRCGAWICVACGMAMLPLMPDMDERDRVRGNVQNMIRAARTPYRLTTPDEPKGRGL